MKDCEVAVWRRQDYWRGTRKSEHKLNWQLASVVKGSVQRQAYEDILKSMGDQESNEGFEAAEQVRTLKNMNTSIT